jgi:acetyl esterase
MAAVTLQRLRDTQLIKPIFQLLLYPALDLSCAGWSYIDFADGFFLTTARVKYYVKSYLNPSDDVTNPLISPLMQSDFSYIPRTHIVTAGFDPLRSDGEAYVQRLRAANVSVSYHCYEEMIHAFLHMNHTVPAVRKAFQDISGVLQEGLS